MLCWCITLGAIEIRGTVRSATKDSATIVVEGESAPNVGDAVEIYFKLPGADAEISVGSGKVTAIRGDSVEAKIDKATGTLSNGQIVRITSQKSQKRSAASGAAVSLSEEPQPAAQHPSLIGKWVARAPNGDKITYVFKSDDTVLWTVDTPGNPGTISAKYTVDYSTKPIHIDIFDFGLSSLKDFIFLGVIEFDGESRFRLAGEPQPPGQDKGRPKTFGGDAVIFTRVQ